MADLFTPSDDTGLTPVSGSIVAHQRRLPSPLRTAPLKTTRYFEEQVLRKRPYLRREWVDIALQAPTRREVQPDGRVRLWIEVRLPDSDKPYMLRVVTLEDGETIHNAFLDRTYRESAP